MQSLSQHALIGLIRTAMEARRLTLTELANAAGVGQLALSAMFNGQAYFNAKTLAAIGEILNRDYSLIMARYAMWMFFQEKDKLKIPRAAAPKRIAGNDPLSQLARQIVSSSAPTTPTELLIQNLMESVKGLQEPMAASAIRHAITRPNRGQGDYDAA